VGVRGEKSGEGVCLLLRWDRRPLASPGISEVGGQMRTSWPSRGRVEWPRTRSPTSLPSWPRRWS